MTERHEQRAREQAGVDDAESELIQDFDPTGQDRSSDYSVEQAQRHQDAEQGREMPYSASDPV
jgi:hypothetical protein